MSNINVQDVPQSDVRQKILKHAAQLILAQGSKGYEVGVLAENAKTTRATIYANFGKDVKSAILGGICESFLNIAQETIVAALATIDPRAATPVECLAAIFRATLASFKREDLFGKVVLQELNLSRQEESLSILKIFEQVDNLVEAARRNNQFNQRAQELQSWKIRQTVFVMAHGLLRALYLDEGRSLKCDKDSDQQQSFTENEVEIQVLRVLQMYCAETAASKIEGIIQAINEKPTRG